MLTRRNLRVLSVELETLYAGFLNQFYICIMFSAGMPILTLVLFFYMTVFALPQDYRYPNNKPA